jgi:hypothetical protein
MMSMLCNCCVCELLILARTWFAFGLPSKTGCDNPVVRPRPMLAYSTLWRPSERGLQSTPLKRSKDPLEYHGVLLCFSISRLRGISTTWSLSPLQRCSQRSTEQGRDEQRTQDTKSERRHAPKSQQELTTQPDEFTTQIEL